MAEAFGRRSGIAGLIHRYSLRLGFARLSVTAFVISRKYCAQVGLDLRLTYSGADAYVGRYG